MGKDGFQEVERNFLKNEFHLVGISRDKRLDGYGMDNTGTVTEARIRFGRKGMDLEIEAVMDKKDFYKFVVWDSIAQEVPTAEFISRNIVLEPGQSWTTGFQFKKVK
jgi:hypothetical protein